MHSLDIAGRKVKLAMIEAEKPPTPKEEKKEDAGTMNSDNRTQIVLCLSKGKRTIVMDSFRGLACDTVFGNGPLMRQTVLAISQTN